MVASAMSVKGRPVFGFYVNLPQTGWGHTAEDGVARSAGVVLVKQSNFP